MQKTSSNDSQIERINSRLLNFEFLYGVIRKMATSNERVEGNDFCKKYLKREFE
jgi:hypothetical protein